MRPVITITGWEMVMSLAQSECRVPGTAPSWALRRQTQGLSSGVPRLVLTRGDRGLYRERTRKCWWRGDCHHPGLFVGWNWVLGMKKGDPGRARVDGGL